MGRCISVGEREYLPYPVPVKFWQCENDPVVSIRVTERFVNAIQNAGGIAYLRRFLEGGHEPQDYGQAVEEPSGNTRYKDAVLSITPAVEEVFLWIRRFD